MTGPWMLLAIFSAGTGAAWFGLLPKILLASEFPLYALYVLLFLVGLGIGSDTKALSAVLRLHFKTLLIPAAVVVGSLVGAGLMGMALPGLNTRQGMAVGAGFGYYSLSSVIISQIQPGELGVIALMSNIMREVLTLVSVPLLVKWFGQVSPIVAGGATAMDTTLPIISRHVSPEMAMTAVVSGVILSMLVPILIPLIL